MIAGACGAPQPAIPTRSGGTTGAVKVRWTPWYVVELREHLHGDGGQVGPFHVGQDVPVPDDRDRAANP